MYTDERHSYRQAFQQAWQKYLRQELLSPLEKNMLAVILQHPEYQPLLENQEKILNQDYSLEENPFLHMSLHMTLADQLRMDRPHGIVNVYQHLLLQHAGPHETEHSMLTVLANYLWQTQQNKSLPSEQIYLEKLRQLL